MKVLVAGATGGLGRSLVPRLIAAGHEVTGMVATGDPGIYQIADDDPAPAAVWLPELARILGAGAPRHIPAWLGRLAAGEVAVSAFTKIRGADNSKAKNTFSWHPGYASWRQGFRQGL